MSAPAVGRETGTGTVDVGNGVELRYERRGDHGPDVVLIPNFFMDAAGWWPFTPRLLDGCRLLAYDLRGQGASTHPPQQPTWDDHVRDLGVLLDRLDLGPAVLVGSSFSALIARDYALARPERVRGLVFAGPALSPWGTGRHRLIIRSWIRTLERQGLSALYSQMYPLVAGDWKAEATGNAGFLARRQGFLAHHTADEVGAGLAASMAADPDPDLLTRLRSPTLLVVGDDDFSLAGSGVEELLRLLPDGRGVVVPRAGHLPFVDDPQTFQSAVAAFVAATGPGEQT